MREPSGGLDLDFERLAGLGDRLVGLLDRGLGLLEFLGLGGVLGPL